MATMVPQSTVGRRRWAATVGGLLATCGGLVGANDVLADQTIVFDEAGSAPQISLIGDSTLAGVRWYADYGPIERYNFVFNAESCRRTIEQSCISREGYRSENVIGAMRSLDGRLGDVVVIMSGYNDPVWTIDEAIGGVVEEARSQGADHVLWLSLRTGDGVDYSDPQEQSSVATFQEYNEQLVDAAQESDGFLQIADWATHSIGATAWFEHDGVHLSPAGVDAVTSFIASAVEQVLAGEDVSPAEAPWTVLAPGAEGDIVADVQHAIIGAGIDLAGGADGVYGNDTMSAVAEYQRQVGDLQVTGAVDVSTARSLGVLIDSDSDPVASPLDVGDAAEPPFGNAQQAAGVPAADATLDASTVDVTRAGDGSRSVWQIIVAVVAAFGGAIALRRRQVVARRRAR